MTDINSEAYIDEVVAKREAFEQRLKDIYASNIPPRVKTMRIKQVTKEIQALKAELTAAHAAIAKSQVVGPSA